MPWPLGPFPFPLGRVNRDPGSLDEQNTSTKMTWYREKGGPGRQRRPYCPKPALRPALGEKAPPPSSSMLALLCRCPEVGEKQPGVPTCTPHSAGRTTGSYLSGSLINLQHRVLRWQHQNKGHTAQPCHTSHSLLVRSLKQRSPAWAGLGY